MSKIGNELQQAIAEMAGNSDTARVNMRIRQVLERYRQAIESIYSEPTAALHLAHTNKVIIKDVRVVARNGEPASVRTLIVYVDDSLFSAELNAQRELIKLKLLELFGEEIEDFDIRISGTKEYRAVHPYADKLSEEANTKLTAIPLDSNEKSFVNRTAGAVEDERVRKALEKAMTADLEWKKGEKVDKGRKNTK